MNITDSGTRQEWDTGARRDTSHGKGLYVFLPANAIHKVAQLFEAGAKKYGDSGGPFEQNWQKGMPVSRYIDSALRHVFGFMRGDTEDPHLVCAAWNLLCALETIEMVAKGLLPAELHDMRETDSPYREVRQEPYDPEELRESTLTWPCNFPGSLPPEQLSAAIAEKWKAVTDALKLQVFPPGMGETQRPPGKTLCEVFAQEKWQKQNTPTPDDILADNEKRLRDNAALSEFFEDPPPPAQCAYCGATASSNYECTRCGPPPTPPPPKEEPLPY